MEIISEYQRSPMRWVEVSPNHWMRERVTMPAGSKMVMAIVTEGARRVTRHLIVPKYATPKT